MNVQNYNSASDHHSLPCLIFSDVHRVFICDMLPLTCLPGSHSRLNDRFPISLEAVHAGEACWAVF